MNQPQPAGHIQSNSVGPGGKFAVKVMSEPIQMVDGPIIGPNGWYVISTEVAKVGLSVAPLTTLIRYPAPPGVPSGTAQLILKFELSVSSEPIPIAFTKLPNWSESR